MRWLEYFFSASLMQVVIQVLCGFTDVWMLSLCAVCIAITQVFGFTTEQILYLQTQITKQQTQITKQQTKIEEQQTEIGELQTQIRGNLRKQLPPSTTALLLQF